MKFIRRQSVKWMVLIALALCNSGCFFAPFIESFKQAGATSSDRQALLGKQEKRFTDALFWGSPGPIMEMVAPEARPTIQEQISDASEKERIVEAKVSSMDFEDGSYRATVNVKVRYYRIPYYVVQERNETHEWEFSLTTGWLLKGRTVG